jgi:zinc transport system ATP-binding protein
MTDSVVDIRGLSFAFNGEPVLEDVDLCVRRGDFLAILGPNGGGKTTLLKIMLGLLRPNRGEVRVFGGEPGAMSGRVGYVPQYTNIKRGFPITVRDVTLMGLDRTGRPGFRHTRADRDLARHAMTRAGVEDLAHKRIDELSGGQHQRVLIARALIAGPDLLVFDEPTSNIDAHGTYCLFKLLGHLGEDVTVIVVSHDLAITASHVNAVACVNRRLIHNAGPELTPDMLALIYGAHEGDCPMGPYIDDLNRFLNLHRAGQGRPHTHA